MTPIKTPFHVLQQIYDFMLELPNHSKKTQFEKVLDFFQSLHEGDTKEFSFIAPETISGNFGGRKKIKLTRAPKFIEKSDFIKWVYEAVND